MAAVELIRFDAKLAQDRPQRSGRKIAATMSGDDGESLIGRVPPDLVGTRSLAHKLASQLPQASGEFPIVHQVMKPR